MKRLTRNKKTKQVRRSQETKRGVGSGNELEIQSDRQRLLTRACFVILLLFAGYLTILYFGHQTVPNSDFPDFFNTGKSLLSFELPHSFKRLPVLGVLQVALSRLIGGQHPGLTAGWLLNSVFFVGTGVFLYLIGKKILGSAGIWFALLVLINPMVLKWLRHPIAETTFVFFIVMTCYFMLRPTRWAYLPAMITSMVRYEGAILILLCFCYDFFSSKGWKSRLLSFVRAGLAGLPLALWMLGLIVGRKPGAGVSSIPYVRNFDVARQMVIGKFTNILWSDSVGSLFVLPAKQEQMQAIAVVSKTILILAIVLALVFCITRKQWRIMLLLGFLGIFSGLHAVRTYTLPRYGVPVIWVLVLIAFYGLKCGWEFLVEKKVLPPVLQGILKIVVVIAALVWVGVLFKYLSPHLPKSRASVSVPYVVMGAVVIVLIARLVLGGFNGQRLLTSAAVFTAMGLMVVCNQFGLIEKVGNGSLDREFKYLADWYYENAEDGDILLTTLPHVVTLYLPDEKDKYIRATQRVPGKTPEEFLQNCYKQHVRYIAWDSRIGFMSDNVYYRRWKMERISFLRVPRDYGPLSSITQIQNGDYPYRFINVYALKPLPTRPDTAPGQP